MVDRVLTKIILKFNLLSLITTWSPFVVDRELTKLPLKSLFSTWSTFIVDRELTKMS